MAEVRGEMRCRDQREKGQQRDEEQHGGFYSSQREKAIEEKTTLMQSVSS